MHIFVSQLYFMVDLKKAVSIVVVAVIIGMIAVIIPQDFPQLTGPLWGLFIAYCIGAGWYFKNEFFS